MQFKHPALTFFAVVLVVNLIGCGTVKIVPSPSGSVNGANAASSPVSERAQQRWDALIKKDIDTAYQFISPGGRSLMTVEQYRPRVNTSFWRAAKVEKASCAAEICEVTVLVDSLLEGVKFTNPIKETWILDAGKWWFVYQG